VLGQFKDTGEWGIFVARGTRESGGQPFPVFNLGRELPSREQIQKRLYEGDVRRRGKEIVDEIDRHFDAEQKKLADIASDGAGQLSEAIDSHMRAQGGHPFPRVFVPATYRKKES